MQGISGEMIQGSKREANRKKMTPVFISQLTVEINRSMGRERNPWARQKTVAGAFLASGLDTTPPPPSRRKD